MKTALSLLFLLCTIACASEQQPRSLAGMKESFTYSHVGTISTFELTARRIYADEAFTLNKREIAQTRKQAIEILNWHIKQTEFCEHDYLLTQQTISAALVKLRGECL